MNSYKNFSNNQETNKNKHRLKSSQNGKAFLQNF